MKKVITVNLNGNAYQVDEDAYNALRAYIDRAEAQFRNSANRREVLGDLEQSIAEKLAAMARPHKTVATHADILQILNEIGPLQTPEGESISAEAAATPRSNFAEREHQRPTRRLYRIRDGAVFAGLCNGLAAYADLNVYLFRVVTVFGALLTGGGLAVLYLILIFVVPVAYTEEEIAAAYPAGSRR